MFLVQNCAIFWSKNHQKISDFVNKKIENGKITRGFIIDHHRSSMIIIDHRRSSIIDHRSSSIIDHHRSSIIINHRSSSIINHHRSSSIIIIINHHRSYMWGFRIREVAVQGTLDSPISQILVGVPDWRSVTVQGVSRLRFRNLDSSNKMVKTYASTKYQWYIE